MRRKISSCHSAAFSILHNLSLSVHPLAQFLSASHSMSFEHYFEFTTSILHIAQPEPGGDDHPCPARLRQFLPTPGSCPAGSAMSHTATCTAWCAPAGRPGSSLPGRDGRSGPIKISMKNTADRWRSAVSYHDVFREMPQMMQKPAAKVNRHKGTPLQSGMPG